MFQSLKKRKQKKHVAFMVLFLVFIAGLSFVYVFINERFTFFFTIGVVTIAGYLIWYIKSLQHMFQSLLGKKIEIIGIDKKMMLPTRIETKRRYHTPAGPAYRFNKQLIHEQLFESSTDQEAYLYPQLSSFAPNAKYTIVFVAPSYYALIADQNNRIFLTHLKNVNEIKK